MDGYTDPAGVVVNDGQHQHPAIRKGWGGWLFLLLMILLYVISAVVDPSLTLRAWNNFVSLFHQMMPVLVWVFVLFFITNLLLKPERITTHLGRASGLRGWLVAITAGILASGPVYAWYAVLKQLKDNGMRTALLVGFLYSRAIKLPLLPFMIHYFGISYTLALIVYLIGFAVINGLVMQKLLDE